MITVEEYQDLLEKRNELLNYFNQEFEELAQNSRFRRKRCIKKCQKDIEKELYFAIGSVWKHELKTYIKGENIDMDMEVVKTKKENKLILFFKKIFHIKPKEVQQIGIEQQEDLPKVEEKSEQKEEIVTQPISTETIEGQMDIEELEDGEEYEEE